MADLTELSEQAAAALLGRIRDDAPQYSGESLEHLANAYAAVVGAMPRKHKPIGSAFV